MKKTMLTLAAITALVTALPASAGLFGLFKNTSAQTQHPIMLVPGIFAFSTLGPVDHFYQVPSTLERKGAEVYVARINAFDDSVDRGEELIAQMDEIVAASNGRITKFNLIGHSQGGMTSRYIMNARPDLIASVTTAGTPHTGSPLADIATGIAPEGTVSGAVFESIANAIGDLLNTLSGDTVAPSAIYDMLGEFTVPGAAAFNQDYPAGLPGSSCGEGPSQVTLDGNPIALYSWGGTGLVTAGADITDPLFAVTALAFKGEPSDGVTGKCANHFGQVLRDNYFMNHLDLTNQVLGLVSLIETNPKTVIANHANRLKNAGL